MRLRSKPDARDARFRHAQATGRPVPRRGNYSHPMPALRRTAHNHARIARSLSCHGEGRLARAHIEINFHDFSGPLTSHRAISGSKKWSKKIAARAWVTGVAFRTLA